MQENVNICIEAATNITEHIDQIHATGELYSTLFVGPRQIWLLWSEC